MVAGATTDVSEMMSENQKKNELLTELSNRPALQMFIKNAFAGLTVQALEKIIEYAKTFSGDIDFSDIDRIQPFIQGQGKYADRQNLAPLEFHKITASGEFTDDELHIMRFLFLCIYHFYNKKC